MKSTIYSLCRLLFHALFLIAMAPQAFAVEDGGRGTPACYPDDENCVCVKNRQCTFVPPVDPTPIPIPVRRADLLHGFYGSAGNSIFGPKRFNEDCLMQSLDPNSRQIVETRPFVNVIFEESWGDWSTASGRQNVSDCMTKRLVEAKALGVTKAFIVIDYIMYSSVGPWTDITFTYRGEVAKTELRALFAQLRKNGVLDMVIAVYPVDEPALTKLTEQAIVEVNRAIRDVMAEFVELKSTAIAVIYNPNSYVGICAYDWVGFDDYSAGGWIFQNFRNGGEYKRLKDRLCRPEQRIILVPGAAFGQDPTKFYDVAQSDPQVVAIISFLWFDNWDPDRKLQGARSNGMAHAYCEMGKKIVDPKTAVPDCTTYKTPFALLTVNGVHSLTVLVGDGLNFEWSSQIGKSFASYWTASSPSCAYGLAGATWIANTANGKGTFMATNEQAGCTYMIVYVACGAGATCSGDTALITIRE